MRGARQIVVAGAGALGTVIALALARAGRRVSVVDPAPLGANASGIAAGMLAPAFEALFDPAARDQFALMAAARELWRPLDLPIGREGALAAGTRDEAEAWAARLEAAGARARVLGPGETAALAAGLPAGRWSAFSPDDWRLEPAATLAALRARAEALGVRFVAGEVADFAGGRAALAGGGGFAADVLVLATGAARGLARLAPELARLTPVKGHILRAAASWPAGPAVRSPGLYLCPGASEVTVGATMEPGVDDGAVDAEVAADLAARATAMAPGLAGLAWRAAAGIRAATPDGLPLVGESAGGAGVILAVGARRNGWLLAPMIAAEVLRLVEGGPPGEAARWFAPGRFGAISAG